MTTPFFLLADQRCTPAAAPGALPCALRAPPTAPDTTSATFDFFSIFNSVSRHRFYPKFVSRKIGGGSPAWSAKQFMRLKRGFGEEDKKAGQGAETDARKCAERSRSAEPGRMTSMRISRSVIRARAHVVNVLSFGAYGVRGTVFARRSAGPVKCLVDPRKTPWRSGRISQT